MWIAVDGCRRRQARFDTRQIATDRISAVQYIKFPLTAEQAAGLGRGAKIVVDHPEYAAETALTGAQVAELKQDLGVGTGRSKFQLRLEVWARRAAATIEGGGTGHA